MQIKVPILKLIEFNVNLKCNGSLGGTQGAVQDIDKLQGVIPETTDQVMGS